MRDEDWVPGWDNLSKVNRLWDGNYFDENRAEREGWYIWVDQDIDPPVAFITSAPSSSYAPEPNLELFVLVQAHTGSEYHKLALEIVRRLNAAFDRKRKRAP